MAETTVHGAEEFSRKINALIVQIPEVARQAGKESAELVVKVARPNVPVRTGRAANSLQVVLVTQGADARGGQDVAYYAMLEYGGYSGVSRSTYREVYGSGRYLEPAAKDSARETNEIYRTKLVHALKSVGLEVT